jgi:hypothetical protein
MPIAIQNDRLSIVAPLAQVFIEFYMQEKEKKEWNY